MVKQFCLRLAILFFFCTINSTTGYGQEQQTITSDQVTLLRQLVSGNGDFTAAKELITTLNERVDENSIEHLWLLDLSIFICKKEGREDDRAKLQQAYVENQFAVEAYDGPGKYAFSYALEPYSLIENNMTSYYRDLVKYGIKTGEYEQSLKYLQLQRECYPLSGTCGYGYMMDFKEAEKLLAIISANLEK